LGASVFWLKSEKTGSLQTLGLAATPFLCVSRYLILGVTAEDAI
jgi:hypothetical protein